MTPKQEALIFKLSPIVAKAIMQRDVSPIEAANALISGVATIAKLQRFTV